jgi:ABC-type multidrug transport system fused ATPase/permease subunit
MEDIVSCDRVLVMGAGRILEQGRPDELLATQGSKLAEMIKDERKQDAQLEGE